MWRPNAPLQLQRIPIRVRAGRAQSIAPLSASAFFRPLASKTLTCRAVTRCGHSDRGGGRARDAPLPNAPEADVHSPAPLVVSGHDVLADEREVEDAHLLDEMHSVSRGHRQCSDTAG